MIVQNLLQETNFQKNVLQHRKRAYSSPTDPSELGTKTKFPALSLR